MVVRLNYPRDQFDAERRLRRGPGLASADLQLDRHQPRRQALDRQDGDGVVDHARQDARARTSTASSTSTSRSRRWSRASTSGSCTTAPASNALMSFVRDPNAADGRRPLPRPPAQRSQRPAIPMTNFRSEIDWYKNSDWSLGDHAGAGDRLVRRDASTSRPARRTACTRARSCSTNGGDSMVVPVSVAVAATASQDADGQRHRRARLRRRGRRHRAVRPALQQRLRVRRERLGLAGRVR